MAEKLKKVDSNPTMKVIKNDEENAFDIFGDAKPKEKAKSAKLDKEVVEVEGYEAKLLARQEMKEQIDELAALKKSVDDELKTLGREKFLEIYKKVGANHKSFYIRDATGCVRVTPSDKYKDLTKERAEELQNIYGDDIVTTTTKFYFTPDVLKRNMKAIQELIMGAKTITLEDKKNLISKEVEYAVTKGAIDKLSSYGKDIEAVLADIQPTFSLYDCSAPEKAHGGLITYDDGYQFTEVSKDYATHYWQDREIYGLDLAGQSEALIESEDDLERFEQFGVETGELIDSSPWSEMELASEEGSEENEQWHEARQYRKSGGVFFPSNEKEYEVSLLDSVFFGKYNFDDGRLNLLTIQSQNEDYEPYEVEDNAIRSAVYEAVLKDKSDEMAEWMEDQDDHRKWAAYERAHEMSYASGGGVGEEYSLWEIPAIGSPIKLYTGTVKGARRFAKKHNLAKDSGLQIWYAKASIDEIQNRNNVRFVATAQQYATGGAPTDITPERGWWSIDITEDDNDTETRNEEVARLIKEGYTSGYYPTWKLTTNVDEPDHDHIAELVKKGYTSGELIQEYATGGTASRPLWEIKSLAGIRAEGGNIAAFSPFNISREEGKLLDRLAQKGEEIVDVQRRSPRFGDLLVFTQGDGKKYKSWLPLFALRLLADFKKYANKTTHPHLVLSGNFGPFKALPEPTIWELFDTAFSAKEVLSNPMEGDKKSLAWLKEKLKPGQAVKMVKFRPYTEDGELKNRPNKSLGIVRYVVKNQSNSVAFALEKGDVKKGSWSWLGYEPASLYDITDKGFTIYDPAIRDLTPEEQKVYDARPIDKEQSERDAISDGSTMYYREKNYFENSAFPYLMVGTGEVRGKRFDHNHKVHDSSMKGAVSIVYEFVDENNDKNRNLLPPTEAEQWVQQDFFKATGRPAFKVVAEGDDFAIYDLQSLKKLNKVEFMKGKTPQPPYKTLEQANEVANKLHVEKLNQLDFMWNHKTGGQPNGIVFKGEKYPTRCLYVKDDQGNCELRVAPKKLERALKKEKFEGEAAKIDQTIYYYATPKELAMPDEKLLKLIDLKSYLELITEEKYKAGGMLRIAVRPAKQAKPSKYTFGDSVLFDVSVSRDLAIELLRKTPDFMPKVELMCKEVSGTDAWIELKPSDLVENSLPLMYKTFELWVKKDSGLTKKELIVELENFVKTLN